MGCFIDDIARTSPAARRDARGCPASTASADALAQVEAGLECMLSYFGDPLQVLDQACAADPGWQYPHTLKAALLLTSSEFGATQIARDMLATSASLGASANKREEAHRAAAQAATDGNWERACELWESILVAWPRDIAALLFAHLFDFYRGDALNLRRRPERVLPQWTPDLPLYGYVLGMAAFGQEECGQYAQAEDSGRAALEINPRDPWAVHAVTHVFEMQGRHRDGARWLATREADWAVDNGFAFHNWFHAGLFHLEDLDLPATLDVYDRHLAPASDMALQRVDRAAILWRLKLLGADVATRFEELRRSWDPQAPAAGFYAFNDLHAIVSCIGAGQDDAAQAIAAAMTMPSSGGTSNHRMTHLAGLPLAQAYLAYAREDYAAATEGLLKVRDRAHVFGGSHAQRDILTLTLMDAAIRSGQRALAQHILMERHPAKAGTALTAHWQQRIGATQRA